MAHRPELTLHHPHRDVTVLCGTRRAAVSARLIRAYLPAALLPSSALLNRRHQLDLDDYIASSAAVRHGLLRPSKMQRVCQELVDILADASDHHHHHHHPVGVYGNSAAAGVATATADPVPAALTDALARAQLEDRRSAGGGGGGGSGGVRHPRTLAAFLALADISRAFGSRRVGAVLATFFARHGARIVGSSSPSHSSPFSPPSSSSSSSSTISSEDFDNAYHHHHHHHGDAASTSTSEHPHAVLLWAWSLTIARMPVAADSVIAAAAADLNDDVAADVDVDAEFIAAPDRRAACLRQLLRARPDVLLSGRYDAFAAAALPAGDAEEVWEGVERAAAAMAAMAATERGRGGGMGPPPVGGLGGWWGWRGGGGGGWDGRGRRIREKERDLERHRRALLLMDDDAAAGGGGGGGGGMYVHEHRERRVVRRSAGLTGGEDGFGDDGGMSPLGLKTTYHRGHHHRQLSDPLDDDRIAWTPPPPPPPRGYGVGVRIGGGGGGERRLRGALDSIKNDQRELRMDVHDVKDELDELAEQINKLGRRQDRGRLLLRKGRVVAAAAADWHDERDHVVQDCCCGERLPEEQRETEWFSEWWDDTY